MVATIDAVERKGATMPYTSRNGHMFSFLDPKGSLALRLSADDRDAFLARYRGTLVEQHGRVMQEFVVVPDDLLERTDELAGWFSAQLRVDRFPETEAHEALAETLAQTDGLDVERGE